MALRSHPIFSSACKCLTNFIGSASLQQHIQTQPRLSHKHLRHTIGEIPNLEISHHLPRASSRPVEREIIRRIGIRAHLDIQPHDARPVNNRAILLESADEEGEDGATVAGGVGEVEMVRGYGGLEGGFGGVELEYLR